MNVVLSPALEKLIEEELKTGHFHDPAEFLSVAVEHYIIAREFGESYTSQEIEDKIARGLAQIERGETIDGEEAFRQLREFSSEQRRSKA